MARLAAGRYGVFARSDAIRLGATSRRIDLRLSSKRWERLYEGVYRLAGAPASWRQRLLAAVLAAGSAAAASHCSAAGMRRLAGFESGAMEISVPRGRRPRLPGVTIHQVPLTAVDIEIVDAIPVTTPARTLLDLAAVAPADAVEEALDDALRRGLVSISRVRWRLDELGRRPGATTMRRLLDARTEGAGAAQSVLETRLLRLLQRAGLPRPVSQHQIRDRGRLIAIVDFAYPDAKLAIEVDGYRWHSGRRQWQHDLERRNEITKRGWRVIHVTAKDLRDRPEATVEIITEALKPSRRPR